MDLKLVSGIGCLVAGVWLLVSGSMDLREILVDFASVHNPAQF